MLAVSSLSGARLVPLIRYRDVGAAIDWLGNAFGFEKHVAVTAEDGRIVYAQVKCGDALVMLSSVEGSGLDGIMKQPDEIGGGATQCCYLAVEGVEAHRARAAAAGAEIVLTEAGETDPRRGYACRDLEGHIWSFGTLDPWHNGEQRDAAPEPIQERAPRRVLPTLLMLMFLFAAGAVTVLVDPAARELYDKVTGEIVGLARQALSPQQKVPQPVAAARPAARDGVPADGERQPGIAAQQLGMAERLLALQKGAREAAESAARQLSEQLERERAEKESAVKSLEDVKKQLASESAAKESALRSAREVREKLERAESISEAWMLRAEQAEVKAQVARAAEAEARRNGQASIETGSPQRSDKETEPAASVAKGSDDAQASKAATAAAASEPAKPPVRRRAYRKKGKPKTVIDEAKNWALGPW